MIKSLTQPTYQTVLIQKTLGFAIIVQNIRCNNDDRENKISISPGAGWFLGLGFVLLLIICALVAGGFFTDHTRTLAVREIKHEKGGYYLVSDGRGQAIKLMYMN